MSYYFFLIVMIANNCLFQFYFSVIDRIESLHELFNLPFPAQTKFRPTRINENYTKDKSLMVKYEKYCKNL